MIDDTGTITSAPFPTLFPPTYKTFWKQLTEALDGRGAIPVTPESATEVIKVIELAMKSALEHRSIPVS
jgi:predicted dehydrogenase